MRVTSFGGERGRSGTISRTTWFASPYGISPASEPRPAIRKRPELYRIIKSPPPASMNFAESPIPVRELVSHECT